MRLKILIYEGLIVLTTLVVFAQQTFSQENDEVKIKGIILNNKTEEPLPGANVVLKSNILKGTSSNSDGKFSLKLKPEELSEDSLIISFMGFQESIVSAEKVKKDNEIRLNPKAKILEEAVVTGKRIIAEEFTVKQMKQLDIYMDPVSKADPLLAVNSMPASTTTDESANISLRGSSPAETGVFFNDVPVYDAVRFSQLNGIGTFSIFNTAIVERMHVFPSNPPIEYGNTSSGLISIQSTNSIPDENQYNISASLANIGGQISAKVAPKTGINIFGNYQSSNALIGMNEQALDDLNDFSSIDLGVHFIHKFSKKSRLKFFNYSIIEGYNYNFHHPTLHDDFIMDKNRNFTIVNYSKEMDHSEFSLNTGFNFSKEEYRYGNTDVDMNQRDLYVNVNYQKFWDKLSIKTGVSLDSRKQDMKGIFPVYPYALNDTHPHFNHQSVRKTNIPEIFSYGKYNITDNLIAGAGIRKNIPTKSTDDYYSGQMNLTYKFLSDHSIILSGGRYNNYALPNAEIQSKTLYQSNQLSLDYKYKNDRLEATAALFGKTTNFNEQKEFIKGIEIFGKTALLNNHLELKASYTLVDAYRKNNQSTYPTKFDLNYFIRSSIKYKNSKFLNISLTMLYRQGTYFRRVTEASYVSSLNVYKPIYVDSEEKNRLPDYFKLDLSISKLWPISENTSFVGFVNVSNLLNSENVRERTYNYDYTESNPLFYSKRTIYFGGMIYF
jgi:hypothetical protein